MSIFDGDVIDGSTIIAHSPLAIFLGNQQNRYNTRTLDSFNLIPSPTIPELVILSL